MASVQHKLVPAAVPTLVLIQHLSASSLDSPEPHLDHLLALALECTLEHDPPATLRAWLGRARGEDASEGLRAVVDHVEETTRRLAAGGMLHTLTWLTDLLEGYSLVAPSEDDELAMSTDPAPFLRNSPLGMYIRRMGIALSKLTFAETCAWWKGFVRWIEGEKAGKRREMHSFAKARLRQDYHLSREFVRTFATDGNSDVSPQQALLHLALVEYEDGGFAEARIALDEATHIARTVGDKTCLAECNSLRKRLDAASPPDRAAPADGSRLDADGVSTDSPHDLLWEVERRRRAGDPIDSLFPLLYTSQAAYQSYLFPPVPPPPATRQPQDEAEKEKKKAQKTAGEPDPDWETGWHAAAARLWEEMGIGSLAELHESLALEFVDPLKPSWDIKLSILSRQAQRLSRQNRHAAALRVLLAAVDTREKREGMGMKEVREWRELIWTVERDWAQRSGRIEDERAAQLFLSRPTPSSTPDEDAPPHTRLAEAYSTHHRSTLTLSIRARLASLLDLIELRLASAGPGATAEAERGLKELEKVWTEVLAMQEDGEGENEELSRAREVKATLEIVLSAGEDSRLLPIVETLEAVLQNYLRLSVLPSALRVLDALIRLCDHLHLAAMDATQSAMWRQRRDDFAKRWIELDDMLSAGTGIEQEEIPTKERWERLSRVVEQVTKAVELSIR